MADYKSMIKDLLASGQRDAAQALYQQLLASNSVIEDPALENLLNATVVDVPSPNSDNVVQFTVYDNEPEKDQAQPAAQEPITFADVGGLEHVKKQITRKIIMPFQKPSLYQRFKKRSGGGVLMYGPPGCGKTMLARATAGECNAQFFNVTITDILDKYIGESERRLHAIFQKARQQVPAVLFFDEIEGLGSQRDNKNSPTFSNLVSLFLSEMDGFSSNNEGVLILAATNTPWSIDSAFRRPGRFDRLLFVPPPDQQARIEIMQNLLQDRPLAETINLAKLAKRTSGYSGADLMNLVDTASDIAIEISLDEGEEVPITQAMLEDALREVRATTQEWLTTANNYARYANTDGQYDDVLKFIDQYGR